MKDIIFKTLMLKGEAGSTIVSMERTGHSGTTDTYTITFDDGSTTDIHVENLSSVESIELTSQTDTEDTYTATLADGSTQSFSVLNHNADIEAISEELAAGLASIQAALDDQSALLNARMDTFTSLPSGSTAGDAELMDIRVGVDGTVYDSAGSAVRGQVGDVKKTISFVSDNMDVAIGKNWCKGDASMKSGYMALDGTVYESGSLVHSEKIPVLKGDTVKTYSLNNGTFGSMSQRFVTAFDDDENVLSAKGSEFAYSYVVPEGVSFVVISVGVATNYMIVKNYIPTSYEAYNEEYFATEKFLNNIAVLINGKNQVKTVNIEGMTETSGKSLSRNLFDNAELFASGKFVSTGANGKIELLDNSFLDTYIVPVDGSVFHFTNCRTASVVLDDKETMVGALYSYATEIDSSDGAYIIFSFNPVTYPTTSYTIKKELQNYLIPSNWIFEGVNGKTPYGKIEGTLADGGSLQITGQTAIKDGYRIVFKGIITSFTSLRLGFIDSSVTNYIDVDGTNLSIKKDNNAAAAYPHGLTIANDITIFVEFIDGSVSVTLISDGAIFKQTVEWYQTGGAVTYPKVTSTGTVCSYAKLETVYPCVKRKVWYFGDSYISLNNSERWAYYLHEYGYDKNVLLNGSAGGSTAGALFALNTLLLYGVPDVVVLGTGMNDGSDESSAPSSFWENYKTQFITACENAGAEVVLCTIPTVPSVNHEQKNSWIKSSGYRYIDFAKSVGSNSSGVWYTGMLSGDAVHPTAKGAKALFSQVLADLPEIMID